MMDFKNIYDLCAGKDVLSMLLRKKEKNHVLRKIKKSIFLWINSMPYKSNKTFLYLDVKVANVTLKKKNGEFYKDEFLKSFT